MSDDPVDPLVQLSTVMDQLDPEAQQRFIALLKGLQSVDRDVLNTIIELDEQSNTFEQTPMGDNAFLDWLITHDYQHAQLSLSYTNILSLSEVYPGFTRAARLLGGFGLPN